MGITALYKDLKNTLNTTKTESNDLQQAYFTVFSSANGRKVLLNILNDLCYFVPAENDEDVALQNYAKKLLADLGVFREDGDAESIVKGFLELAKVKALTWGTVDPNR